MQRFKNVLILASETGTTDAVLARARWLAEANGARLTFLDIAAPPAADFSRILSVLPGARAEALTDELLAARHARLDKIIAPFAADGFDVEKKVLEGTGFIETIRHVLAHDNDLVLKGAERSTGPQFLRGGDLHLLRKCPCPVWILNSATEPGTRRIVAAVDPDPEDAIRDALNQKVMQLATSLAAQDGAHLDVINAWQLYEEAALRQSRIKTPEEEIDLLLKGAERASADRLSKLTENYADFADRMRVIHVKGEPADVISEHAETESADTLVMGTVSRTGIAGFFIGNTAETVLNRVSCSVLTVKPKGFVSPVTAEDKTKEEGDAHG